MNSHENNRRSEEGMRKKSFRTGMAASDITPEVGGELCGFGWYLNRVSTGIIEPLYANALVWQLEETKGVIISCDLLAVSAEITESVRQLVGKRCGIPLDHIMVCATHTHSGPPTKLNVGWGDMDPEYMAVLPERIAKAAFAAHDRLVETALEYGEIAVEGISFNREDKGGSTELVLKVIKLMQNDQISGFLAYYSCHPVVMCEDTSLISGDFVGIAVNKLKSKYKVEGLFLQGSIGDQNPVYCHKSQKESLINLRILSDRFADYIERALASTAPLPIESASVVRKKIELPRQPLDRAMILRYMVMISAFYKEYDDLPETVQRRLRFEKEVLELVWQRFDEERNDIQECELHALRLGDWVILAHPTELFFRFHQDIISAMQPYKTFLVGFANDSLGYIPTPDKYDVTDRRYSYPSYFAPLVGKFPYRSDVGQVMSNELIKLGQEIVAIPSGKRVPATASIE
jgi:hypothetical protein